MMLKRIVVGGLSLTAAGLISIATWEGFKGEAYIPVPGDVMCPLGMNGRSKKVSDLLNEARIPVSDRSGVPVVRTAPGGAVVWVAGVRADERFKCTAATRVAYLLRVVDAE
jgi:tRNA(Ile)-lysidine synthase